MRRLAKFSSTKNVSVSVRMTARSTTFCNSRMLPGQPYSLIIRNVSLPIWRMVLRRLLAKRAIKYSNSTRISSARSRKGGIGNWKNVQAIKKILAKRPGGDSSRQITVSCCDDADIYLDRTITPNTFEFAFLQDAQQRDLSVNGEIPNLVQEQRPAVSRFKPSNSLLQRSSESALFVAEKLRSN